MIQEKPGARYALPLENLGGTSAGRPCAETVLPQALSTWHLDLQQRNRPQHYESFA
jgi:hypothetical protein